MPGACFGWRGRAIDCRTVRYSAFLRAINIGKNNRIRMEDLRALCGDLRFERVSTYLQTGNVHFEFDGGAEAARDAMEAALIERGLKNAYAMVWPRAELEKFVAGEPFAKHPAEGWRQYITLYRDPLPRDILDALEAAESTVALTPRIHCAAFPLGTPTGEAMNSPLAKKIKVPGTTRYWHVFRDFLALP